MSGLQCKIASLNDLDQVARLFDLYRQFYQQEKNVELAKEFLRKRIMTKESVIILVQDINGEAVGFCQLYPSFCSLLAAPIYVLSDLFVLPEKRRSGAARKLLLAAEGKAKQDGMKRMDLTTAKSNLPAQSLYHSLGWEQDQIFFAYNKLIDQSD